MLALKVANTNANAAAMKATAGVQTGTTKPYSFLKKFAEKKAEHPLKQKLQARQAAWKAKREAKKESAATKGGNIVQFRLDDIMEEGQCFSLDCQTSIHVVVNK